ncbi:hypothetical protein KSS87_021497 [Heliosperma pusillum]|nr:hypothetical protein KSS87_021497 [Heliosperma pusillum]
MEAETEDQNGVGDSPFRGLVICVTGLSKEAREQVMEATERLGGTYSPTLHPNCTHLLVHIFRGRKLEHALNHGFRIGLFVVTVRWFVDSVAMCVALLFSARLHESPYSVRSSGKLGIEMREWFVNSASDYDSCFPIRLNVPKKPSEKIGAMLRNSEGNFEVIKHSHLLGRSVYIDSDVSAELHSKVVDVAAQEGALLLNQWFVGCGANYIVCEGSSIKKYLGHSDNIVSPIWFLKTSKERSVLRFVGLSADLARETGLMLKNIHEQAPPHCYGHPYPRSPFAPCHYAPPWKHRTTTFCIDCQSFAHRSETTKPEVGGLAVSPPATGGGGGGWPRRVPLGQWWSHQGSLVMDFQFQHTPADPLKYMGVDLASRITHRSWIDFRWWWRAACHQWEAQSRRCRGTEINKGTNKENCHEDILFSGQSRVSPAERLKIVKRAKCGIKNRRARRLKSCEGPLRAINSSTLLDSICWSISEPTSTVAVFEDSLLSKNVGGVQKHILFDGQERLESDSSFSNLLRPLTERTASFTFLFYWLAYRLDLRHCVG